jgi:4-hydroxy-3-methylbut-2-enyl diphosphate reductase
MGVRRAVEITLAALNAGNETGVVYTLGPLIHNPEVLEDLKKRNVNILQPGADTLPDDLSGSTVIIRAHGISPLIEEELSGRGAFIIDATCPHVKSSQLKARSLSEQGFAVFLAGEKTHAEITGIRSYVKGPCFVTANPAEAENAAAELAGKNPYAKTVLLGQTTINPEEYLDIGEAIKRYFPGIEIIDTLCGAARERRNALTELSGKVDAFVIAGGKDSANTRRLLSIAENSVFRPIDQKSNDEMSNDKKPARKKAWLVENAAEIPPEVFSYSVIGLAAGASTPDKTIDEIELVLRKGSGCSF